MKKIILLFLVSLFFSCEKKYEAPIPEIKWDLFESADAVPLNQSSRNNLQGVYITLEGASDFGTDAVIKWSYTIQNGDTTFHLSVFMPKDITVFICEGKRIDSLFLLSGYWRKMATTETGLLRLMITAENGGALLLSDSSQIAKDSIVISGTYSNGDEVPSNTITLSYDRPLQSDSSFLMLAHRGGGRSSDLLPFSENSIEMIRYASRLGATGIEIDVRLTRDGIPILYHDEDLNDRLIQKTGLIGPIENYTYSQLSLLVRLIHGEKIPTLFEALNTVLYETPLKFVWLDIKFNRSLSSVVDLQRYYLNKVLLSNRELKIVIGIPDDDVFDNFKAYPDFINTPSLCELDINHTREVNSLVWAPRWTEGVQENSVNIMHSEGRKSFAWTLDIPEYINQFLVQGDFDGLLSNYPSSIAYHYYVR